MTFWTIVLAGAVGGVFAGIFLFLATIFGFWLNRRRR